MAIKNCMAILAGRVVLAWCIGFVRNFTIACSVAVGYSVAVRFDVPFWPATSLEQIRHVRFGNGIGGERCFGGG